MIFRWNFDFSSEYFLHLLRISQPNVISWIWWFSWFFVVWTFFLTRDIRAQWSDPLHIWYLSSYVQTWMSEILCLWFFKLFQLFSMNFENRSRIFDDISWDVHFFHQHSRWKLPTKCDLYKIFSKNKLFDNQVCT